MKRIRSQKLYIMIFLFLICITIVLPMRLQYISLIMGLISLSIIDPGGVRDLGKTKFWGFIIFVILVVPLIAGEKNYTLWGIGYSEQYLLLGIQILMRGLSIYIAVVLLNRNVTIEYLATICGSLGFKDLSVTLPIALNILPIIRKNFLQSLAVFYLRGGFKKHRIKNLEKLLIAIMITTIRTGEEIYQIIEMKNLNNTIPVSERSGNNVSSD